VDLADIEEDIKVRETSSFHESPYAGRKWFYKNLSPRGSNMRGSIDTHCDTELDLSTLITE